MFGITSEPQTLATVAEVEWGPGFPMVGDPHHEIRKTCSDRGWVDVFFNENYGCGICLAVCPWSLPGRGPRIVEQLKRRFERGKSS